MRRFRNKITQKATEHMDGNLWVPLSDVLLLIDQEEESAQAALEYTKELESYIEFIGERLSDLEVFVSNRRSMQCPQELIDEGKQRRKKLAVLKEKAGLTTKTE